MKHHFNPKTQKFGICRATIKECKFRTHCNSIEECNQYLDKINKWNIKYGYSSEKDLDLIYNNIHKELLLDRDEEGGILQTERNIQIQSDKYDDKRNSLRELKSLINNENKKCNQNQIEDITNTNSGITYSIKNNEMITTGFCTSIYPELSLVVDKDKFSQKDIDSYIDKNRKILEQDNHYLGTWYDRENEVIYVDVSVVYDDCKESRQLSLEKDQIAFFDFQTFDEVVVNRQATSGQTS